MGNRNKSYRTVVRPDWIDHNGHVNVAYFVVAFDEATDAIYEEWGVGMDYPDWSGCSVFTLGMNVDYFGELVEGDVIRIATTLFDYDSKRIHYFHEMTRDDTRALVASNECLCMNVNLSTRKSERFPDAVQSKLDTAIIRADLPDGIGRTLGIRRR